MRAIEKGHRVVHKYDERHGVAGMRDRMDPSWVEFLPDGAPNDSGWHYVPVEHLELEQAKSTREAA